MSSPSLTSALQMQVRGVRVYISSEDIGDVGGKSTILLFNLDLSQAPFVYNLSPAGYAFWEYLIAL